MAERMPRSSKYRGQLADVDLTQYDEEKFNILCAFVRLDVQALASRTGGTFNPEKLRRTDIALYRDFKKIDTEIKRRQG